ncbi:MAG: bifunctional UDP-N-acetylglucosamine diphosphorylase/glucosamine-1-phosphate N-acetyltransferase GlmU, partial [Bdellovibrio sp.]
NAQDLKRAYSEFLEKKWDLMVVTAEVEDPGSLGRIVRSQGQLRAIVEAREASHETLKINEINTAIYFTSGEFLQTYLPKLQLRPEKQEYYLTDLVQIALEQGEKVGTHRGTADLASGVNTQRELSEASKKCFYRKALELMEKGVLIWDPHNVYVEDSVEVEAGSVLWPQVFLRGQTKIGSFVAIEANSFLMDCQIGDGVLIRAHSYLEKVQVGNSASIGPFARLRPETFIGEGAHVGNFVEMKKVKFGKNSKAGHLTYLGDAVIGERVNVGCGTITCNYAVDRKKYETRIEDDVFVGSDSQFVAPVQVGAGAVIASGSTITKDVPARALAVARGRQTNIESYVKVEGGDADSSRKAGE